MERLNIGLVGGMDEDRELVAGVIAGDGAARARFHDIYRPVFMAIFTTLRRGAEHLAEDLVQDVFEALLADDCRRLRAWRGEASLKGYLVSVARNLARDRLRGRLYRQLGGMDGTGGDLDFFPGDEPEPYSTLVASRIEQALARCLEALSPRELELIGRRRFQGQPPREIAACLGISPGAVSTGLNRAQERLRRCLGRRLPGLFDRQPFEAHDVLP